MAATLPIRNQKESVNDLISEFVNNLLSILLTKTEPFRENKLRFEQISNNPLNSEYRISVLIEYGLIPKDFREQAGKLTREDIVEIINKATPVLTKYLIEHQKKNIEDIYEFIFTNIQKYPTGQVEDVGLLEEGTKEPFNLGRVKGIRLYYYENEKDIIGKLQRTTSAIATKEILTYDYYILRPLVEFLRNKAKDQLIESQNYTINKINKLLGSVNQLIPLPDIKKQYSVSIKKKFYTEGFNTTKFRIKHKNKLNITLDNGLTLAEQLDKSDLWFSKLSFKDLEMFTKLFGYIRAVKTYIAREPNNNYIFKDFGSGFYGISTKLDKNFYKHFLKEKSKGKNKKGFIDRDKKELLKWLYKNQENRDIVLEDPITGKIYLSKLHVYSFVSQITKNEPQKT